MALPALATTADLSARKLDTSDTTLVTALLAAASATVRRAASSPILQATSTVTLYGFGSQWLDLPGKPVTAVTSVQVDGTTVTDYTFVGDRLFRRCGWGHDCEPSRVVVALTHGLATVPADVVDLVCSLVGAGINAAAEGYAAHNGLVAELDGDYQVTYTQGAEAVASVMQLPPATRLWLRKSFGGGVALVETR